VGPQKKVGRVETGVVFEQAVEMEEEQGRRMRLRRIELQLEEPTPESGAILAPPGCAGPHPGARQCAPDMP
jgi:hypothetical protein